MPFQRGKRPTSTASSNRNCHGSKKATIRKSSSFNNISSGTKSCNFKTK
jgi:hypothetical protein